ncbi:MAG: hypothetical protein DI535_13485 [Citrobacter freundii]|nr:MAG: hypothetical protein DI535_13485 [Citrobacter freundii]
MRYLYALLFVVLQVPGFSQTTDTIDTALKSKNGTPVIRIYCGATLRPDQPPLYIIDDELINSASLDFLSKNDIRSIDILRDSSATALYGTRGSSGVIIIKTKNSRFRSFQAIDAEDGTSLAGATFTFTAVDGDEVIRLIADKEGRVMSTSFPPGKKYTLMISSVGYKDFQTVYTREKEKTVQQYRLLRDVKDNIPVIVKSDLSVVKCRYAECWVRGIRVTHNSGDAEVKKLIQPIARLYPNPVVRGSTLKLELNVSEDFSFQVKLTSLSGAALSTLTYKPVKGLNRVDIPVANQWAAGAYFLQVISQHGKLLKQDKLIIQ